MSEILLAGFVAVAIGMMEVIKAMVKKFGADKSVLTDDERAMLKDLHEWHAKEDTDGVKVWYIRKSLAEAITTFSASVEAQTRALEAILDKLVAMDNKIDKLENEK